LEKILAKHRTFNFQEFQHLLKLAKEASQKIKDEHVILLLGSTGCGKSTSVHYLCGSMLREKKLGDLPHIEACKILNEDLYKVRTSPFAKSETRWITPININLYHLGSDKETKVILVDTPGSGDTESYEVDISNGLGILEAVRLTKSVRILILISYKNFGARSEDIKKQLIYYADMIKDTGINKEAFTFCFTHIPQEITLNDIFHKVKECHNKLTENDKANDNFVKFIEHLINKAHQALNGED
jgi:energy-coupling factor transporter ATP-binding protein EcfA2